MLCGRRLSGRCGARGREGRLQRLLLSTFSAEVTCQPTRHVVVPRPASLSQVVSSELAVSLCRAEALIGLGSVYVNEQPEVQNSPTRRRLRDVSLAEGSYVRIYPAAARYDVQAVDWREAIVHDCEDFVVVNKPAGIPCGPTVSNFHENVMESIRATVQCDKLYNPHRLDVATTGVLVFGKTKQFARDFGNMIRDRKVIKTYKLLVMKSFRDEPCGDDNAIPFPPVGTVLTHYMETSKHYPKILHIKNVEDSKECVSVVKSVSHTAVKSKNEWELVCAQNGPCDNDLRSALKSWCDFPVSPVSGDEKICSSEFNYLAFREIQLQLLTGRTHQLRAQALATGGGSAIVGDRIYSPWMYHNLIQLQSEQQTKKNPANPSLVDSPYLGLQACAIEAAEDFEHVLGGRAFSIDKPFWSKLFTTVV